MIGVPPKNWSTSDWDESSTTANGPFGRDSVADVGPGLRVDRLLEAAAFVVAEVGGAVLLGDLLEDVGVAARGAALGDGAAAFHSALDEIPDHVAATEKIRLALRAHLRVVAQQLDVATVFVREWRYLEGERREEFLAERRRYEERFRALFREGRELGGLRTDLDDATATLLALSAANWAYTWLRPDTDTDALADRFYELLINGMRGYATR